MKSNKKTTRAKRIENLKPYRWKPGQSGNPKGRPPRAEWLAKVIARELGRTLKVPIESASGKKPKFIEGEALTLMIRALIMRAIREGETRPAQEVFDRFFGRVPVAVLADIKTLDDDVEKAADDFASRLAGLVARQQAKRDAGGSGF